MSLDTIRVGVVGAGHWGPNLIRNFADHPRAQVVRVVDREPSRLEQVRHRFPDVRVSEETRDVLNDDTVDAVVIATPTVTHFELAKSALSAGKHVLVEKPICSSSAEADALCSLAEGQDRVLMVGHVFLFNSAVQAVHDYVQRQMLGRLYYISMIRTNLGPIRMDVNAAWDLASHDLSIVQYWLGGLPAFVSAVGGNWINPSIEDAVFATLRYPDNILVNLHVSWINPRKAREVTVVGDQRMLTFDDMNMTEPVRVYDKQVTDARTRPGFIDSFASFRASVRDGDIHIPKIAQAEPLRAECDHFIDCVRGQAHCVTDGRFGADLVRVLEAIDRSVARGGTEQEVIHG